MKISELIAELEKLKHLSGDVTVDGSYLSSCPSFPPEQANKNGYL